MVARHLHHIEYPFIRFSRQAYFAITSPSWRTRLRVRKKGRTVMSSPSRCAAVVTCKILGISVLVFLLFLSGCGSSGNTVTIGLPAKLAFTVQPSNVAAGSSITPAVQVTIQDASGNTVTTATNQVTIAIGTNPSSGTLSGTTPVTAVAGVATFSNLSVNNVGTGYTLTASATGLTGAASSTFNVTVGAAAKLAFTTQPVNVAAGASITVAVSVEDALGTVVTTATNQITIAIGTNPSGGTLSGTTSVTAVAGVATFSNLSVNNVGTGYTLTASATGLTGATSSTFSVTAAAGVPSVAVTVPGPTFSGENSGNGETVHITVTPDATGDVLTPALTLSGAPCSAAACGTLGSVTGASGSVSYTVQYTPPTVTSATLVTLTVSSNLTGAFAGTANFTVFPAGSLLVASGGPGGFQQVGGTPISTFARVYNDGSGNPGATLELLASGHACPSSGSGTTICGTLTIGATTTGTSTTGIPFTQTAYTYTPPSSYPQSPYDRPMVLVISNADNTKRTATNFALFDPFFFPSTTTTELTGGAATTFTAPFGGDTGNSETVSWTLTANDGSTDCHPACGVLGTVAYTRNGTNVTSTVSYTPPSSVPTGSGFANPIITATLTDNTSFDFFNLNIVDGTCGTGNNAALNGSYAYLVTGGGAGVGYAAIIGNFIADGAGNITGGLLDLNRTVGATTGLTIAPTGSSYSVGSTAGAV